LITKEIAAYAAGLFDGEGCIRITRTIPKPKSPQSRNHNFCYTLYISVAMTDPSPIKFLKKHFSGSTRPVKNRKPGVWRPLYCWWTWGKFAIPFLKIVYPYCLIKKEQIENAIEFREHMNLIRKIWPRERNGQPDGRKATLPLEILEYRDKLFKKSKDLKKKIH